MILVHCCVILSLIVSCLSETETNEISQEENDKLDGNLRKALLKALDELQSDENSLNATVQKVSSSSVITSFVTTSADQSSTTAAIPKATSNESRVIVQKSNGYQQKPIITFVPTSIPQLDPVDDAEQIISASSSFTRSPKYQSSKSDIRLSESIIDKYDKNLVSITEKSRITLSTSAATTAAPIITSSTEESEAKIENIQFFQAPLVAAFTVHHDEVGLPKNVEPLYRGSTQRPVSNQNSNAEQLRQLENLNFKQESQTYKTEQLKLQQYLHYQEQIRLQTDLKEKQKLIEQQIQKIQQQQYHQDYSLRQQQLIQEQKLLQQRQSLLEQQQILLKNLKINSPAALTNDFNGFRNPIENRIVQNLLDKTVGVSSVTLQPSVSFQPIVQLHNTLLPPLPPRNLNNHPENFLNSQLPPLSSNNINFRQSQNQITSNFNSGNVQQQLLQPFINAQNNFNTNNQAQNNYNFQTTQRSNNKNVNFQNQNLNGISNEQFFNKPKVNSFQSIRGLENFDAGQNTPQGNRVFRHETGTGNFLNNNYNDGNNAFTTASQSNRYFRSNSQNLGNYYTNQNFRPAADESLNRLLYNSGINLGKQSEDLNIVSKVLSLNHLGVDNYATKSHYLKPIYTRTF